MKTATVRAEITVIHGSGYGMRLKPGVYDVVDIDGAKERGTVFLKDSGNGELLCAALHDPDITIKETA